MECPSSKVPRGATGTETFVGLVTTFGTVCAMAVFNISMIDAYQNIQDTEAKGFGMMWLGVNAVGFAVAGIALDKASGVEED